MIPANWEWHGNDGASADALTELQRVADIELPREYLDLLAFSNGGEGSLPVLPFNFCLDSAEEAATTRREGTFGGSLPGFFVIGGSGGGELIALDVRGTPPWPVVTVDMVDLQGSVVPIASDIAAFIALIGMPEA